MAPLTTKTRRTSASTRGQDPAIADVTRGVGLPGVSEDERRALGTDASTADGAGEHDDSPEANTLGPSSGASVDTYAGMPGGEHPNMPGEAQPLVMGQAPVGSAHPYPGSKNVGEKFHPDFPNAKAQSPVLRGVDPDTGERSKAPDFADLKKEALDKEAKAEDKSEKSEETVA